MRPQGHGGPGADRAPDQAGRTGLTMRIVSLLPSATEIICALGLEHQLVGVTHECDYPPPVRELPKVTQTLIPADAASAEIDRLVRERLSESRALYTLDLPVLESLKPDLIVTQALCDVCAVAEQEVRSAACGLPGRPRVVNLEPRTLAGVLASLRDVADAAGLEPERAESVIAALESRVEAVASRTREVPARPRVVLLEWLDPPFSCGHWSPELVRLAGGIETLGVEGQPSRSVGWEDVLSRRPDVVVIACCGFDAGRTLQDLPALPRLSCPVYVIDGSSYFSRPGPRLVDSLEILAHAILPEIHPLPAGLPEPILVRTGC